MKTHGEVQAAIDAGKQLQAVVPTGAPHEGEEECWFDISGDDAGLYAACNIRIKPEPPKRLECWVQISDTSHVCWIAPSNPIFFQKLREVRPGDALAEQIERALKVVAKRIGEKEANNIRDLIYGTD